ncbi:MAG: type II toxin-antitoxin system VapC family toxin [Candidatus Methylomirabilia bacterium]
MTALVVDASVAIKWALPEVHSDAARRLLDAGYALLVPDLFFAEVGNTLWQRARRGEVTTEEARTTLQAFVGASLEVHSCKSLMALAFDLALRTRQSVYDGLYLSVAILRGCQLVTADRRLYDTVKESPLASHLLWVGDVE